MKLANRTVLTKPLGRVAILLIARMASASPEQVALEPLEPCSRRTPLVVSEIMHHPTARSDGANLEFVELYNSQPWFADLSGFRLEGEIEYIFPEGTRLAANSFLVLAKDPSKLTAAYAITNVAGPYAGSLNRSSGEVRLKHRSGAILLDVRYSSGPRWPVAPSGAGHSLVLGSPSFGETDPRAWSASALIGGSPGAAEPIADQNPLRSVVINEVSARPINGSLRFVELYNHSASNIDLSGCWLTDDPAKPGLIIPSGAQIPPGGFLAFDENQLGFRPSPIGAAVFLLAPDRSAVLDAVRYGAQATGVPEGRSPDGNTWRSLNGATLGARNAESFLHDIVINEIMYHPISDNREDEYVELLNQGSQPVDLSGWRFVDGIDFTFPTGAVLAPSSYVVVARDAARLRAIYPHLSPANLLGDYSGSLSDSGERLALARPESIVVVEPSGAQTSVTAFVPVDEVTYRDGGAWGEWADGGGSSLELIHSRSDHRLGANWADSDESGKAEWTTVEFTGPVENYLGAAASVSSAVLQVMLLGPGECELDDVEAMTVGQTNRVANAGFDSTLYPWTGRGNHTSVQWLPGGVDGGGQLHLRAVGRGDPAANHLSGRSLPSFRPGEWATLRARARWRHGSPEILLRFAGNGLEAYGRMRVPANLGTPGLPNSRAVSQAGPAIADVRHWPVFPALNQPVVVTARVHTLAGPSTVALNYRLDPATNIVAVAMTDDGLGDDAVSGDGIYSAAVPARTTPVLVAFHVIASDTRGNTRIFPSDAPSRECLVRVGEPTQPGQFGGYHLWMTAAAERRWKDRERLSNEPLPATFVSGNYRVIYGAGAMYAGSGYWAWEMTGPAGKPCDYSLVFPKDDRFLGSTETTLSWPGLTPNYPDPTAQSEQAAYWIAEQLGLPFNYRRYVVAYFNGVRRNAVMEDTQQPDRDLVEEWFPNDDAGDLYKMQGFYDLDGLRQSWASLEDFPIPDSRQKLSRYRWNWGKRSARGTMNDYSALFELIKAVNLSVPADYNARLEQLIDIDQWARTLAVERIVGNFDSFTYTTGQNMYFYKPTAGPWALLIWDMDFQMGGPLADPVTTDLFTHQNGLVGWTVDPTSQRLFRHPPLRRAFLRALQTAVNGPLTNINELIDAKAAAFKDSGIPIAPATSIKNYLNGRRAYISTQLNKFRAPFKVTSPSANSVSSSNSVLTLQGIASFEIQSLTVNGLEYPVTWTTLTNWSAAVPLWQETQTLTISGRDAGGRPIPDANHQISVTYSGAKQNPSGRLAINEWMASNGSSVADPADGDFEDWFELFNPNPFSIDLSGYSLTEDPAGTARFVCPPGTVIRPNGFLLVWADGEPAQNGGGQDLHVDFKLPRSGGTIALLDAQGAVVEQITFGPQATDVSQGRQPDGASAPIASMPAPTPRASNSVPEVARPIQLLQPERSVAGTVTLSWTADVGTVYRVQFADSLTSGPWVHAAEAMAADEVSTITLPTESSGHRYYRIELAR